MKMFNDSKIYLYFSILTAVIVIVLSLIGGYSKLIVEPQVEKLLNTKENVSDNYKKAFLKLRNPQVFAGYSFFDRDGNRVKNTIIHFDQQLATGREIPSEHKRYLQIIMKRRVQGSTLTLKSMVFVLILSLISMILFLIEKKQFKEQ